MHRTSKWLKIILPSKMEAVSLTHQKSSLIYEPNIKDISLPPLYVCVNFPLNCIAVLCVLVLNIIAKLSPNLNKDLLGV